MKEIQIGGIGIYRDLCGLGFSKLGLPFTSVLENLDAKQDEQRNANWDGIVVYRDTTKSWLSF